MPPMPWDFRWCSAWWFPDRYQPLSSPFTVASFLQNKVCKELPTYKECYPSLKLTKTPLSVIPKRNLSSPPFFTGFCFWFLRKVLSRLPKPVDFDTNLVPTHSSSGKSLEVFGWKMCLSLCLQCVQSQTRIFSGYLDVQWAPWRDGKLP